MFYSRDKKTPWHVDFFKKILSAENAAVITCFIGSTGLRYLNFRQAMCPRNYLRNRKRKMQMNNRFQRTILAYIISSLERKHRRRRKEEENVQTKVVYDWYGNKA
jgi:hypothetical protein